MFCKIGALQERVLFFFACDLTFAFLLIAAIPSFDRVICGNSGCGICTPKETDETILLHMDAIHPIGEHTTLLTGVYGDFSGTGLTPWSVGLRLGFLVGK